MANMKKNQQDTKWSQRLKQGPQTTDEDASGEKLGIYRLTATLCEVMRNDFSQDIKQAALEALKQVINAYRKPADGLTTLLQVCQGR